MSKKQEKLSSRIRRYFVTLAAAVIGRNPFIDELEEIRDHYEKTADNVRRISEMYDSCAERMEQDAEMIRSLQVLVENLRQRLAEKDALLTRTKEDYQKRIEAYNAEIDRLKNENKVA